MRLSVLVIGVVAACGGAHSPEPDSLSTPGTGAAYSSMEPSKEIGALAADFRGSCAFARPPGDAAEYTARVRARTTRLGAIRVRATASFDVRVRDNLIGEVPSGTTMAAAGPVAGGTGGATGYAVLVRDGHGRVCRGYVSAGSVEPLG